MPLLGWGSCIRGIMDWGMMIMGQKGWIRAWPKVTLSLELSCSACGSFKLRQTNQKINSCEMQMHIALTFLLIFSTSISFYPFQVVNYCILSCWAECNIPLTWMFKLDHWVECGIATFGHFISYISVGMWLIYKQASTCLCVPRHDIQGCRGNGEQQGHWSCHRQRAL